MTTAFPLTWPMGWPRTNPKNRKQAAFRKTHTLAGGMKKDARLSVGHAVARLQAEIDRLGGKSAILSTNIETRMDGTPRSDRRDPDDTGAAVYFKLGEKDRVLACDRWDRVADNIAALAAHIDAIRRQDRYGVGTIDQAFTGYTALPSPTGKHWSKVLGVDPSSSLSEIERVYKMKSMSAHPDNGGTTEAMAELNIAIQQARRDKGAS